MILFGLLCCGCIIFVYIKEKEALNPVTIFVSVWLASTLLACMGLSKWHTGISAETFLTLSLVVVVFTLTFWLLCKALRSRQAALNFGNCESINPTLKNILIVSWFVVAAVEVVYSGGFPLLWHFFGAEKTYFDFGIPTLHGLMNSVGLVIILLCFYDVRKHKREIKANIAIICIMLAYYTLLLTRQVIISAVIEIAVVAFLLKKKEWSFSKILVLIVIAILGFGLLGNIRTGYDEFMYVAQMKYDIPKPLVGFYWVYMYLSMTIANINKLIIGNYDCIGLSAFSSLVPSVFAPVLNIDNGFYTADYLVTPAFNVSGFFANAYLGFGLLGAAIYSALYGAVSAFATTRVKSANNEVNILIFAVVVQIVSLSFFDDMLLYLPCSFQIILLLALSCVSLKMSEGRVL